MTAGPSCPLPLVTLCAVGSGAQSLVGGATSSLASDVLSAIVGWILGGADWLLQHVGQAISASTTIHLGAPWFEAHYAVMASIAAVIAVPMLFLAAVQAVLQQSPALLLRAAFVQLPLAGLLTAVAIQGVQLSLSATDALCATVSGGGGDVAKVLARIGSTLMAMGIGPMPGLVATLGGLLIVAGGLMLWLELLVRSAAVYVAVLFLPLALASLIWPAASHWCRRLVETIAALVLSKFVVVAVLSPAAGAPGGGAGVAARPAGGRRCPFPPTALPPRNPLRPRNPPPITQTAIRPAAFFRHSDGREHFAAGAREVSGPAAHCRGEAGGRALRNPLQSADRPHGGRAR